MSQTTDGLEKLKTKLLEIQHLRDAASLLSWDQETYMPTGGGQARADQIATLQTLAHDKFVSTEMEVLVAGMIMRVGMGVKSQRPSGPPQQEPTQPHDHPGYQDFHASGKCVWYLPLEAQHECSQHR